MKYRLVTESTIYNTDRIYPILEVFCKSFEREAELYVNKKPVGVFTNNPLTFHYGPGNCMLLILEKERKKKYEINVKKIIQEQIEGNSERIAFPWNDRDWNTTFKELPEKDLYDAIQEAIKSVCFENLIGSCFTHTKQ